MWIEEQLKILSDKRYYRLLKQRKLGETNKSFWKIVSNDIWDKINFHFELRLTEGVPLSQSSEKIIIAVHLESKFLGEQLDTKVKNFFKDNGCKFDGNTIKEVNDSKLDSTVEPLDFSSEEAAKKTIQEIIKVLDLPEYQKCAEIANTFIATLSK